MMSAASRKSAASCAARLRSLAGRYGTSLAIFAFGAVLVGFLWSAVLFQVHAEKESEIKAVTKDTGNLARVFEEHVARAVREADQVLQFTIDQYRYQGTAVDLRRLVEDGPIINRVYTYFGIIDPRGNVVASSRPAGRLNVADRDYFRVHAASDTGQLHISGPAIGKLSGQPAIHLSRRINNPDLSFAGVAMVSIDPEYFAQLYSRTELGEHSMITLVGRDGVIRARRARNEANGTVDTSRWALFRMLPSSPRGSYVSTGAVDGLKRIFSYRALQDYPLVVLVGAAENEALADFLVRRRSYLEAASLATLVIFCFCAFLMAMVRRQEDMAKRLRRHNAELGQALEANKRLATIVEDSNDAIISRGLDGIITSWNAGAERVFGYSTAEAVGRPISDLILPPDIRQRVAQNIESIRRGEIVAPYETRRRTKYGSIVEVLSSVSPLRDEAGAVTGAAIIMRDISALKRAEGERAQLAAIVESTTDAVVSRSLDGSILSWNAAAERMFGWSAREAIGSPISIIVPAERRGEMRPLIERVLSGETIGAVESTHVRKDGARVETSVTFSAIRSATRSATAVSLIYRDITEAKRLERAARRKTGIALLLESLARTANESGSPQEAMQRCLEQLYEHGGWSLGCVGIFNDKGPGGAPCTTYWHAANRGRFETFISVSDRTDHTATRGIFVGKVLREKRPVWITDIAQAGAVGRIRHAASAGLHAAFAFPVLVQGEVAAFLEFFSEDAREPDLMMLEAIGSVGAQLARLVERERADSAIRASEARLRAIVDNEPECIKVIGPDGSLLEMNRSGIAMLEAESIEQVRAHGLMNFVLPEYRRKFGDVVRRCANDETVEFEFEIATLKGTRRWMTSRAAPIALPGGGGKGTIFITRDVSEHKRTQEKIEYLSNHDALTGLPNRNLFQDRLELAVAHARRRGEVLGVLLANLDRFKKVNESLGHEAGDALLREVAARLKSSLREVDTIARLGGNDYAILVEGAAGPEDVVAVAEKLIQALAAPFEVRGQEVFVSAAVGVASCVNGECTSGKLLEQAEMATARAKKDGGGGYHVYQNEPVTLGGRRLTLESRLRRALENGELALHYQPKIDLLSGTVTGAEALLRWNSPGLGDVSPAQFIPIAEETGLIVPIGAWVLETACAQTARWRSGGHDISIAVNLSPRQFRQRDLAEVVGRTLARSGLEARHLELEITEGTAMSNAEQTVAVLAELHHLGVKLAVDDYGTGYSSLSYLRRFPLHCLKIDRSFVRDAATDANSVAIVRATIALAHSLRLKVIAEGIETEAQRTLLLHAACDEGQGFLFSKPLPMEAFGSLLEGRRQPQPTRAGASA